MLLVSLNFGFMLVSIGSQTSSGRLWWFALASIPSRDYDLPTATLFTRVTLDLIETMGNLSALIGRRGEERATIGLPTWTLDLARPCYETKYWSKWWSHRYRNEWFYAAREMPLQLEPVYNSSALLLGGLLVDRICEIARGIMSGYTRYSYPLCAEENIISLVSEWEEMRKRFNSRLDRPLATGNKSWYDALWVTLRWLDQRSQ